MLRKRSISIHHGLTEGAETLGAFYFKAYHDRNSTGDMQYYENLAHERDVPGDMPGY